ncbi:MAG: RluA family pseudouridine synthase [Oscillospiraceae bacterium]|jgi:23S rRNA pseudouridine1911/1915/1917 synthase|nr:RluA family pseudouridine synthase [Oscillospiraceae bacterium]MBQ5467639.1 RluA family pseudouridine synthase [Oscillospiraceae bacterium]
MILHCTEAGVRLDVFLAAALENTSRSAAQKLLEAGAVTLDGKPLRKQDKTVAGADYAVVLPEVKPVAVEARAMPLDVVWEDADLLVLNKPKGVVVHPAPGHWDDTLVNALLYHCRDDLSGINGELRPGIVHRIDKDTSGLLIVAKNDFAHQALAAQLQDHSLSRVYDAIVCGGIREDEGTVDAPIGRHPTDRKKMAVTVKNSRRAVTHYEVVERFDGYTRIRCRLETGRTHQIRVHMAYKNHPILGDTVYGRAKPELGQTSQCLHAGSLTFRHPRTGEPVTVTCPLPDYFEEVLEKLRGRK